MPKTEGKQIPFYLVYDFSKKGQATQEDYKDVMRLCRDKIRGARAQIELNLATGIKYN